MSDQTARYTGIYATAAAVAWLVFAPLLALAYFATPGGAEELTISTVAAWAEPARNLLEPLLTFADPGRVYATYLQALALLFPAVVLSAVVARRQRPTRGTRAERWGWRIAVAGYLLAGAALLVVAVLLVALPPANPVVDAVFLAGMVPGMLLSLIGSTVLGIALLRAGHRPRLTGWLLAFAFPLGLIGSTVLGHNSLGMLPLGLAWAATARTWIEPAGSPPRRLRRTRGKQRFADGRLHAARVVDDLADGEVRSG